MAAKPKKDDLKGRFEAAAAAAKQTKKRPDNATLLKWQALAKPVWKDYADKNENCAKLLAFAQKLL